MRIVTSRRSFLAGALAAATAVAARPPYRCGAKSKVALQMYSIGRYVREVQPGGFAAVFKELDVGWCATAGEDPCAWLRRFPNRSPTIHAKEHAYARSSIFGDLPPGKKGVDWDALFAATDANGVEWYVIETESMQRKSMIPPTGCIEFLNSFKV